MLDLFRGAEVADAGEVGFEVLEGEVAVGVGGDAAEAGVIVDAFEEVAGFARGHAHLFGVGGFGGFKLFCDGDGGGDFDGVVGLGVAEDGVGLGGVAWGAFEGLDGFAGVAGEVVVVDAVGFGDAGGAEDGGSEALEFFGCLGEVFLEGGVLDVCVPGGEVGGGVGGGGGGEGIPGEAAGGKLWLGGGWVAVWVPGGCFVVFAAEEVVGGFADLEEVGGDWVGVVVGVEGAAAGVFDGLFAAGASFVVVGEFGGVFCEGVV